MEKFSLAAMRRSFASVPLLLALALMWLFVPITAAQAAAGVTADINLNVVGRYSGAPTIGSTSADIALRNLFQLTPGTTTGKADKLFASSRTLAASATEDLDLAGVLTDPLGTTLTFVKVKAIYVKAAAANTNSVIVGGAASATFVGPFADATDKITIPPGGAVLLVHPGAGWTVTATTADLLKVANSSSGTSVTYEIVLIGTSA